LRNDPSSALVGLAATESGPLSREVAGFGANFRTIVRRFQVGSLSLPPAQHALDAARDRHALRGGEIFADLVFGVLARDDARDIDNPRQDACPTKHLGCLHAPLAEHQPVVAGDADGLQQPQLAHALGEGLEVAHFAAMALTDHDVAKGHLKQHDGWLPPWPAP
jgi:hypothetical protein